MSSRALMLMIPICALIGACGTESTPVEPAHETALLQAVDPGSLRPHGMDSVQLSLTDISPELAGFYWTGEGEGVVLSLDTAATGRRGDEVRSNLSARVGGRLKVVHVRKADFAASDLLRWKDLMTELMSSSAISWVDWDEANNRVAVGVVAGSDVGKVRSQALGLGIPQSALRVEVTGPVVTEGSLSQRWDDPFGGLEIATSNGTCTLGFSGTVGTTKVWVTNSHCTLVRGGVENTAFRQPNTWNSWAGTETRDPVYFTGSPCPVGNHCRYSDAAMINSSRPIRKAIARTLGEGTTGPSPNLNFNVTVPVTGEQSIVFYGTTVKKTGQHTGITVGPVTATCINNNYPGNVTLLCQNRVSAYSYLGDSGSPVWIDNGSSATLVGILHGGDTLTYYNYSTIGDVQAEVGPISTY